MPGGVGVSSDAQGRVFSVNFSANGKRLISTAADTTALLWDLAGGFDAFGTPATPLSAAELDAAWADLASADAAAADRSLCRLMARPAQGALYVRQRLHPAAAPAAGRVRTLIAGLNHNEFAERERATPELRRLGPGAQAGLLQSLAGRPTSEARRRIIPVLAALKSGPIPGKHLQELLAQGERDARLTEEAKASLKRLARRPVPPS